MKSSKFSSQFSTKEKWDFSSPTSYFVEPIVFHTLDIKKRGRITSTFFLTFIILHFHSYWKLDPS